MEGNVCSWLKALKKGYNPREYSYEIEQIPMGTFEAVLDFKIWAKRVVGITNYFTVVGTNSRIQITTFLSRSRTYHAGSANVDFYTCPLGATYRLKTGVNGKGRLKVIDIVLVKGDSLC